MSDSAESNPPAKGQFLVYRTDDGQLKIDVRLEGETAWLTQAHMAELFQTTIPNVSMHLRNVHAEGELQAAATVKEFLIVRQEGNRQVSRTVEHYNLDAIISAIVAPSFRLIYKLHLQVQNLRRTRDLLLPRLLSGQVELKTEEARA